MPVKGTFVVLGLRELGQRMRGLSNKLTDKPMRRAVAFGAGVIRDEAKARAPVGKTARLKDSISTRRDKSESIRGRIEIRAIGIFPIIQLYADNSKNRQKGRVGKKFLVDPPTFYWKFVEFGTVKMKARPFLRPAFNEMKQKAAEEMRNRLKQELDKLAHTR